MAGKRRRQFDAVVPLHTPKRILAHVADEYDDMDNRRVATELKRHLRGQARAFMDAARYDAGGK
ncbi:MAG: hypothetical protein JO130_18435 [Solirubrobacterales bacterium]|nr:hypothetical protein [Solirubrobacterales bacterium]